MGNPVCNACKHESKLVKFTSFEYYYCPACKQEIDKSGNIWGAPASCKTVSTNWVNKGDIGSCETCGMDLIEATEDIAQPPGLWEDNKVQNTFKMLTNTGKAHSIFHCYSCINNWNTLLVSPAAKKMGCGKWDYTTDKRSIHIKGKGWI